MLLFLQLKKNRLKKLLKSIQHSLKKYNMKINMMKTKVMVIMPGNFGDQCNKKLTFGSKKSKVILHVVVQCFIEEVDLRGF